MMFITHLMFGILSGILVADFLGFRPYLFVAVAAVASSFPDIDIATSKISRKLPPFAVIAGLFGHRGFFHSVFPPLLLYAFLYGYDSEIAAAVLVGYFSHLLLDAMTRQGVCFFYPLSKVRARGPVKTNGFSEMLAFLLLLAVLAAVLLRAWP